MKKDKEYKVGDFVYYYKEKIPWKVIVEKETDISWYTIENIKSHKKRLAFDYELKPYVMTEDGI